VTPAWARGTAWAEREERRCPALLGRDPRCLQPTGFGAGGRRAGLASCINEQIKGTLTTPAQLSQFPAPDNYRGLSAAAAICRVYAAEKVSGTAQSKIIART